MTVRAKTIGIVGLTILVLFVARVLFLQLFLVRGIQESEEDFVRRETNRGMKAILYSLSRLEMTTRDYASWDDTYAFVQDRNPAYVESNFIAETFLTNRLTFVVFANTDNVTVFSKYVDLSTETESAFPEELAVHFGPDSPLMRHAGPDSTVTGILTSGLGPFLVVSRPILTSDYTGPVRGALVMGRRLDTDEVAQLSELTSLSLAILAVDDPRFPSALMNGVWPPAADDHAIVQVTGENEIAGYQLANDIYGKPAFALRVVVSRELYSRFLRTIYLFIAATFVVSMILCVAVICILEKTALSRLTRLDAFVNGLQTTESLSARTPVTGNDEISRLADHVNRMVERLEGDVAERKRAEAALKESRNLLAAIFDNAPNTAIQGYDSEGRVLFWNRAAETVFGYSEAEAIGKTLDQLILSKEDGAEFAAVLQMIAADGSSHGPTEWEFTDKFGERKACLSSVFQIPPIDGRPAFVCMDVDISERQRSERERIRLETQLRKAQKMEAVGQLAGGIAHDFNNLLQAILGYSELLSAELDSDSPRQAEVQEVRRAAERAATLTRQLLAFGRRQILVQEPLNLNDVVNGVAKMIRSVTGEHIELEFVLASDIEHVAADRGQIEQVLMNLCLNARDAMPHGGRLVVETENVVLGPEYVAPNEHAKPGHYVSLRVSDTGTGMDSDTLARVFEPFFSTKELGHGTGLGLAMVYGIIKQHEGFINAHSEVGQGSVFTIYLPAVREPAPTQEVEKHTTVRGGHETILLAEDDELVRRFTQHLLRNAGYTVLTAVDGEDAVQMFQAHKESIDVLVFDVVMPKLQGWAAFERIRAEKPSIRCVFTSGYSEKTLNSKLQMNANLRLLRKPYHRGDLLGSVRGLLDA